MLPSGGEITAVDQPRLEPSVSAALSIPTGLSDPCLRSRLSRSKGMIPNTIAAKVPTAPVADPTTLHANASTLKLYAYQGLYHYAMG